MSASRTSNKQILTAIEDQTAAITQLAAAIAGAMPTHSKHTTVADTPVVTPKPEVETEADKPTKVRVSPEYLSHMKVKGQDHANNKGEDVILYGRVNLNGETKLAYCLASRWTKLRDRGLIGAVARFSPV